MNAAYTDARVWTVILALGIGTYIIRLSFLGLIGDRPMPGWALRLLRYTPMAVIPGMVAPLVLSPAATDGQFDATRGVAALVTLIVGLSLRNTLAAIVAGGVALFLGLWAVGPVLI
ncbi:AzlD domain-containing protein [Mesobaculum littorinae]|uniref:AzlD domain-containing protein n=1 Tax=Mesobaculum littorinae TaxID=2486419 RepID=A0A438AGI4_9RHOB|nr:AzlD domain-containing protein [Mesobaculum littorinae]RVV97816.1 AzlD domain-containing protein [Mesobaculum littorinae]